MGEVYRAFDSDLGRQVAIKVLPDTFVDDPERIARFEREAKTLAALNHPNIAQIYGLEKADGRRALVMELVEGPTLADRIANGPIPVDEALPIARQIAEALEAAHEHGIIHRDLKPANIKIRLDATVKVLDFGLAKTIDSIAAMGLNVSQSSTITSPAPMTSAGMVLGTTAYMSPEQARGRAADKRTDIWAFGCVVYEMLTGRRAFEAADGSDTLAAVLRASPDWNALPRDVSTAVRLMLKRCLEKEPGGRIGQIGTARFLMTEAVTTLADTAVSAPAKGYVLQRRAALAIAAGLLGGVVLTAAVVWVSLPWIPPPEERAYRALIPPPDDAAVTGPAGGRFAVSPDGRQLAFVATGPDRQSRLWIRRLDGTNAHALPGTEDAAFPFWSPDGRFVAFTAQNKLKTIEASGGPALTVCDVTLPYGAPGAWSRDGTILLTPAVGPLHRVRASGGVPSPITTLNTDRGETVHGWPSLLPDGQHFLYLALVGAPGAAKAVTYVASLNGLEQPRVVLADGTAAGYVAGHLLYPRGRTLVAHTFDTERLELSGQPRPIADRLDVHDNRLAGAFTTSDTGVLVYQTTLAQRSQLIVYDRLGTQVSTVGDPSEVFDVELSPDGTLALASVLDTAMNTRDLWIFELRRNQRTRFTSDPAEDLQGVWHPDGGRITFSSNRKGQLDLYEKAVTGTEPEIPVLTDRINKYSLNWSSDGRFLLYQTGSALSQTLSDLYALPFFGDRRPFPVVRSPFDDSRGRISADGRWVAYHSNESGRDEVYVTSFPDALRRWRVSTGGGRYPKWRRDGRELFYLAPDDKLIATAVDGRGAAFNVGVTLALFDARPRSGGYLGFGQGSNFDVFPDGQRFLVNVSIEQAQTAPISVILNWPALLKKQDD
jgi:Tol biopolymer transport system component